VLRRFLDDSHSAEVHRNLVPLTTARLVANACYRFTYPFAALIASGLDVGLSTLGIALTVAELAGLLSPLTGRLADRLGQRRAMSTGLGLVAAGTVIAATSTSVAQLAVGLVVLSQSKVLFDLGLASWIAAQVPYETRSRIVGLTETSWALGLFLGVSTMGLVTAATSWRFGYLAGGVATATMAAVAWRRLRDAPPAVRRRSDDPRVALPRWAWWAISGQFWLMAASQALFVTFGSWLDDSFGVGAVGLAGVTVLLGFGELAASLTSARRTDSWGKERSTALGAAVMIPAGIVLAIWHDQPILGVSLLLVSIVGFEFGVVSSLAIGSRIVPGSPARGVGTLIAAGTLGRAAVSVPVTRLYERSGFGWPAAISAMAACGTIGAMTILARRHPSG
jgi:predicted MFS family arabinose efflux permease